MSDSVPTNTQKIRGNSSRLLSGSAVAGFFRLSNVVCVLLINIVITRMLSQKDAGIYFSLWGAIVFVSFVGQLGLRQAAVKWIADALERNDEGWLRAAIVTSTSIAHVSFATICGGAVAVYWLMKISGREVLDLWGLVFLCLWLFGFGIQTALCEIFRGYSRHDLAGLCGGLLANGLALVGYFVYWRQVPSPELNAVLAIIAAASMVACALIWILVRRCIQGLPTDQRLGYREALKTSTPMMLAATSRTALETLDTVILGMYGLHGEAALYAVASRLAYLILVPAQVVSSAISPEIVTQQSRKNQSRLESVLQAGSAAAFVPAALMLVFFVFWGEQLLTFLYKPSYAAAAPILIAIGIGNVISTWNASATPALLLSGHQRATMLASVWVAVACTLIQFIGAKWLGPVGIAITRACALAALTVALHGLCRSKLNAKSYLSLWALKSLRVQKPS